MSSTTWTPRAVASKAASCTLPLWRAVEAQHVVSTMRLVDGLAEQEVLEGILERTKPALPAEAKGIDYLLFTPFRYPPTGSGSRFRAVTDAGVFYGAEERRTACAEVGYWRWRFLMDSPGLADLGSVPHTLFKVKAETTAIDLRTKPFAAQSRRWTAMNDYRSTQHIAQLARQAGVGMIRYQSVRDPDKGGCAALLTPEAFVSPRRPLDKQTWLLTVTRAFSTWQRNDENFEFVWA